MPVLEWRAAARADLLAIVDYYIVVYAEDALVVTILRVLHAARQWPPRE